MAVGRPITGRILSQGTCSTHGSRVPPCKQRGEADIIDNFRLNMDAYRIAANNNKLNNLILNLTPENMTQHSGIE